MHKRTFYGIISSIHIRSLTTRASRFATSRKYTSKIPLENVSIIKNKTLPQTNSTNDVNHREKQADTTIHKKAADLITTFHNYDLFEQLLARTPRDESFFKVMALVADNPQRLPSLSKHLQIIAKTVTQTPCSDQDAFALLLKIQLNSAVGNNDAVLTYGKKFIALGPDFPVPLISSQGFEIRGVQYKYIASLLGFLLVSQKKLHEAADYFTSAIKTECNDNVTNEKIDTQVLNAFIQIALEYDHELPRAIINSVCECAEIVFNRTPHNSQVIMMAFVAEDFRPQIRPQAYHKYYTAMMNIEDDSEQIWLHKSHACTFIGDEENARRFLNKIFKEGKDPDIKEKAKYVLKSLEQQD